MVRHSLRGVICSETGVPGTWADKPQQAIHQMIKAESRLNVFIRQWDLYRTLCTGWWTDPGLTKWFSFEQGSQVWYRIKRTLRTGVGTDKMVVFVLKGKQSAQMVEQAAVKVVLKKNRAEGF